MEFKNKNVLITGGTSGIGLATAKAFINEGANVLVTGKNAENLKNAASEINSPNFTTLLSDTAILSEISALENKIIETGNKLDVLYLNAGISQFALLEQATEEEFDSQFNINVKGLYFTLQKMIPHLRDGSSVIVTSSAVSTGAYANLSIYSATKSAVDTIARIAATELADRNIRVNIISPGPIDTPILGKAMSAEDAKSTQEFYKTGGLIPMKRIGDPNEVAKAVLYLSSGSSSFITGSSLSIDGGVSLRR